MNTTTAFKYRATKALVSNGMAISKACARTGLAKPTFYQKRKMERTGEEPIVATKPDGEIPLEEQVIASDLSAKAKVKILTTLLNA